jgi:hypothetical protein
MGPVEAMTAAHVTPPVGIVIRAVPGRGFRVFASRRLPAGEVVERAPVVDFPQRDWTYVTATVLGAYSVSWNSDGGGAVALGYGALYGRSPAPSAQWRVRVSERVLEVVATTDLEPGDEITVAGDDPPPTGVPEGVEIEPPTDVVWGESHGRGRGVFAARPLLAGELIERAPCLTFPAADWKGIEKSAFDDYCFVWGEDRKSGTLPLGYASLYNHSFEPNATYVRRLSDQIMDFVMIRDVAPGEEIRTNYNRDPLDMSPVWFEVI